MPENTILLCCPDEKCGHQRRVPRELFYKNKIRQVTCSKCGGTRPAPAVLAPKKNSSLLILGVVGGLLAVVIPLGVYLSGVLNPGPGPGPGPDLPADKTSIELTTEALDKAKTSKSDLVKDLAKLEPAIENFNSDREDLKRQLKNLGVVNSDSLQSNRRAQPIAKELVELIGQLRAMNKKKQSYEQAAIELDSLIRRLDRKIVIDDLGLSKEELAQVTDTLDTIDVRIQVAEQEAGISLSALEADEALDEVLKEN